VSERKTSPLLLPGPLLLAAPIAVLLSLLSSCGGEAPSSGSLLQIPVVTIDTRDVSIHIDVVGEIIGSTDVTIRARVNGFLDGIHFQEGTFVNKGDLLYTIDPQPFQAKLAQARAMLAQAHTGLAKTKSDLDRIRPLAEMHAVSEQDLDSAVANCMSSEPFGHLAG